MRNSFPDSKQIILATAEELFATKGIANVSLREINIAAGQKNSNAVQYHFKNKEGVIRSIIMPHYEEIETKRNAIFDTLESTGSMELSSLVQAYIVPLASKLDDAGSGRNFLRIMSEIINDPTIKLIENFSIETHDSTYRFRMLVESYMAEEAITKLHRRFTAIRFIFSELGRRASQVPKSDNRLFISHLKDLVVAILTAPTSDETYQLLKL